MSSIPKFRTTHTTQTNRPARVANSAREAGMVSIMVTLILMIVLSLIVLGFAQVARRNQRETLDRQLSTQAFYAAETGVNDVQNLIAGGPITAKPNCDNTGPYSLLNPTLSAANSVSYTCVQVNPFPDTLTYDNVGGNPSGTPSGTGVIVPLVANGGHTIKTLTFTWLKADASNATPTVGCPTSTSKVFSNTSSWTCDYGVLRFDLVPTSGLLSENSLQSTTMSSFVVPKTNGGIASVGFSASGSQDLIGTKCDNTSCTMTINSGLGGSQYYLRASTFYKPASVFEISATDEHDNPVDFQDAQALIDSTGKAQDVLRRIQVRVPLTAASSNQVGDYALESTDSICKRFAVMDGYYTSDVASVVPGMETTPPVNPLCQNR